MKSVQSARRSLLTNFSIPSATGGDHIPGRDRKASDPSPMRCAPSGRTLCRIGKDQMMETAIKRPAWMPDRTLTPELKEYWAKVNGLRTTTPALSGPHSAPQSEATCPTCEGMKFVTLDVPTNDPD